MNDAVREQSAKDDQGYNHSQIGKECCPWPPCVTVVVSNNYQGSEPSAKNSQKIREQIPRALDNMGENSAAATRLLFFSHFGLPIEEIGVK